MALSRVNRPLTVSGLCLTAALALAAALAAPASNGRGIQYASTANVGGR